MFEALVLGVVQGLTEFFPVSSTAHIVLIPWVAGWTGAVNSLSFDVSVHAGTLLALIACFYRDWLDILRKDRRLLAMLVLATIPAGAAGLMLKDYVETVLRSPIIIVFSLVAFGLVMMLAERLNRRFEQRIGVGTLNIPGALLIGIAQAVAIIPGVSRSGITISAGLMLGMRRDESARFSFLLSMPVVFGACLLEGKDMATGAAPYDAGLFLAGFAASAVSGFFAIRYLLSFLRRHSMDVFVYYRFVIALAVGLMIWARS